MGWGVKSGWNQTEELINVKKDTNDSVLEELRESKYKAFVEKTYKVIRDLDESGLPKTNEQIRLITYRSFNASLFLAFICERTTIETLLLVVYSINFEAAKLIHSLVESGKIKYAKILMSNLRNVAHRQKEQITRDMFVDHPNIELFFASSHAKIMSMKTADGNFYTVEGSGNLSLNSRVESYVIDNSENLYNFTENWMNDIKIYLKGKKELIIT